LGYLPYSPAFAIQEAVFQAHLENRLPSVIILQENPPTFTIGRAGSQANLLVSPEALSRRGIEVLEVNRGGDITYHGPGQIIASPLFFLGDIDLNANAYLHRLEDVLIDVLAIFGIASGKQPEQPEQPGVWVGEKKIGAVGIAVRHGFTFHGKNQPVCYSTRVRQAYRNPDPRRDAGGGRRGDWICRRITRSPWKEKQPW